MNSLVIILGILIIFFIYLLFLYITSNSTTLVPMADFTQAIPTIAGDNLPGATSVSYAYGVWLYVQNWDSNVEKTILYRPGNFKLYLDKSTPTLKCDIAMSSGNDKTVTIVTGFQLQKWVCVILSMDNQYLDCYLDGKLVTSYQIVNQTTTGTTTSVIMPKQPTDATASPLYLGNSGTVPTFRSATTGISGSGWSASALLIHKWQSAVDPQTAWNWYMQGNGKSKYTLFSQYGVNYTVLKDNVAVINNKPLF